MTNVVGTTLDQERLMLSETADDLAQACTELAREGKKFLTIWATKLKRHALVEGIPRQRLLGTRSLLNIPLITGDKLVFDEDAKKFNVE
jgi:hypothetical protein